MSEQPESKEVYELLNDDDVFQLENGDTFTVYKFKAVVEKKLSERLFLSIQTVENNNRQTYLYDSMRPLKISEETTIIAGDIVWKSSKEGIKCKAVKTSSKGWQKGRIIIEINGQLSPWKMESQVSFCSDEPPESKSLLDEIRQSDDYKSVRE